MKSLNFSVIFTILCLVNLIVESNAQTRQSVGAAEINGAFRDYFEGKYKGSYNEIKFRALGKGKLRVAVRYFALKICATVFLFKPLPSRLL